MANDPITFLCPACSIKLTIPGNLAGVTGPCPTCNTLIQAPYPIQARPQQDDLSPGHSIQQPLPEVQSLRNPAPTASPLYAEIPATSAQSPYEPPPLPVPGLVNPDGTPIILRPEPRQLPARGTHGEVVARQMPEVSPSAKGTRRSHAVPRHPHRRSPLTRFALLFLFLVAAAVLVGGVLFILKNQSKNAGGPTAPKNLAPPPAISAVPPETRDLKINGFSRSADPSPVVIEPAPDFPEGMEPVSPSTLAREVLMKFLAAKTLEERLPMIETKTPQAELAASCLARPLPEVTTALIDAVENNPTENLSDFYHSVDFLTENGQTNPQVVLVRIRGSAPPKVVVDPLLDTFGGRLAAYAAAPQEKSGLFQVTIWAVAACYSDKVPSPEKKLTLKLQPRDNAKEIASAYFSKQSKIGRMLEDGTYSLSYGKAKACTVMLRWNQEDNPQMPYLEAVALKTLDWNP